MSLTTDLMALGTADSLASKLGNHTITASTQVSVATGLTAAGNSLGTALALTSIFNQISTAAASTGVSLPVVDIGVSIRVRNDGANTLTVYPPNSSSNINGGSNGAGVSVSAGATASYIKTAATKWFQV